VAVGSGLSTVGPLVSDPLGTGDAGAVTEPLGVADGLTDGERVGEGDRVGVGRDRVGVGVTLGDGLAGAVDCPVEAAAGTGIGRTRMYSARKARNKPEMIRVEIRGRPFTRHSRWAGRYQDRRGH
jgi:hypothetical protein